MKTQNTPTNPENMLKLYLNFSRKDDDPILLWAANDLGDLVQGVIRPDLLAYEKRAFGYQSNHCQKKLDSGYSLISTVSIDFITSPQWFLLIKFWRSPFRNYDLTEIQSNKQLIRIAEDIIENSPPDMKSKINQEYLDNIKMSMSRFNQFNKQHPERALEVEAA